MTEVIKVPIKGCGYPKTYGAMVLLKDRAGLYVFLGESDDGKAIVMDMDDWLKRSEEI